MNPFLRLFYAIFGEPNVTKAVKNIDAAIDKLEKAVNFQHLKAEAAAEAAKLAHAAEELAVEERERAKRVAAKMADLLK